MLLWEYIAELSPALLQIAEPSSVGSGHIVWNKRHVTQELASAILDFHAITSEINIQSLKTILAIGAHPWQLAYVFLQQIPGLKYLITDVPGALLEAQQQLERVFPEKKIFSYRPFDNYDAISGEFEESSICFVEPPQLFVLPKRSVDLGLTMDVLDKLSRQETNTYFEQLESLIKGYFYFKEQKVSAIKEADYLVPDDWEEVFWRTCPLYPNSFEALFLQGTL